MKNKKRFVFLMLFIPLILLLTWHHYSNQEVPTETYEVFLTNEGFDKFDQHFPEFKENIISKYDNARPNLVLSLNKKEVEELKEKEHCLAVRRVANLGGATIQ
ncbi:hypothetical protein [Neobacillus drentensis]|uniref:hypothetical protein n=1 Tax=Neobacillus drentensis TaxID=220684 RepID=UPI00286328D4|nr:hypothetical protein [Neobacillus drentensis]MDR7237315.1 hypothetical protein [Neobacillus drentensis]